MCMLPLGINTMRNVPTVNWMIRNYVHAQCPAVYPVSGLSCFDRVLMSNGKGRNLRAECWISNRDIPRVFVYIRSEELFT